MFSFYLVFNSFILNFVCMIFFIYINMGFAEHLEYVTFTKFWKFSTNFSSTFFTISLLYFPYIRYLILFQMFFSLFIFSQSLFCLRYFLLMYLHMVWQFTLSCPICSFFQPLNFKIQMLYFSALQFPFVYFFFIVSISMLIVPQLHSLWEYFPLLWILL